jgi:hypothetical protein
MINLLAALGFLVTTPRRRPDVLDRRRETVEHPFGSIKRWMSQGTILMCGREKVRAEFHLYKPKRYPKNQTTSLFSQQPTLCPHLHRRYRPERLRHYPLHHRRLTTRCPIASPPPRPHRPEDWP